MSRDDGVDGGARDVTIVAFGVGKIGGMELQLNHIIGGLLNHGYRVVLIANRNELDPHPKLSWHRVPAPGRPFPFKYLSFALIGSVQVARHRRGVLHTLGAIVLNRADVSTINHCHAAVRASSALVISSRNSTLYRINARVSASLARLGERIVYRPAFTARAVVATAGVAEEISKHFPPMSGRVSVIPNGVDTDRFKPDQRIRHEMRARLGLRDKFAVIFLGGDWVRKGLRPAMAALVDVPDAHLLVVGRGETNEYQHLSQELGLSDRVTFLGVVDDVRPMLAASDAFLLPSIYETWSLPAFEAAASGLPLIATRVHGVDQILRPDENGWFTTRDPREIASYLRRLSDDAGLRRRFGDASRRFATAFSWGQTVVAYERIYDEVRSRRV